MAILATQGQPVPTTPWELITASDTATQVVLGFLALLSAISWTIIFSKWIEYRQVRRVGAKFLHDFERAHTLEEASRLAAKGNPDSGPPALLILLNNTLFQNEYKYQSHNDVKSISSSPKRCIVQNYL
jgi:biopolymer transport protein ExbB/TolQ